MSSTRGQGGRGPTAAARRPERRSQPRAQRSRPDPRQPRRRSRRQYRDRRRRWQDEGAGNSGDAPARAQRGSTDAVAPSAARRVTSAMFATARQWRFALQRARRVSRSGRGKRSASAARRARGRRENGAVVTRRPTHLVEGGRNRSGRAGASGPPSARRARSQATYCSYHQGGGRRPQEWTRSRVSRRDHKEIVRRSTNHRIAAHGPQG